MTLFLLVLVVALVFEYINGFHDTANSIATVVSTKVLTPRQAIVLAVITNLIGAIFVGTTVAKTIGSGLVDTSVVSIMTVLCALVSAIIWNLITWWLGIPSSSSHALIGGLCGAALASSRGDWGVLKWSVHDAVTHAHGGLWPKVVLPMFLSPLIGFVVAAIVMFVLYVLLRNWRPRTVNRTFGFLQLFSAGWMGLSHGTNDAQKTMGIITLALFTGTRSGAFEKLPSWLHFLNTESMDVATWVIFTCAITMALGTAGGGWRIIRTMGHKMVKLQPVHGFAAETTAALIIQTASHIGVPLSTTHVISTSIMGVGATKRFDAVKWGIVGRIVWAWVLTLPVTGLLGFALMRLAQTLGA
ncbi:MAG TPA: inorganic phosphate transporter [Opitutaceae bacterium]|nr:inorganic phosphate transporter [Opitutaceae bacterium]